MRLFTYYTLCLASIEKKKLLQVSIFKKKLFSRHVQLLTQRFFPLKQQQQVKEFYIRQLAPFFFLREIQDLNSFDCFSWNSSGTRKLDQNPRKTWLKNKVFPYLQKNLKPLFIKGFNKKQTVVTTSKQTLPPLAALYTLFPKQKCSQNPLLYTDIEGCFLIVNQQIHNLKEHFSQKSLSSSSFISRLRIFLSQEHNNKTLNLTGEILRFPQCCQKLAEKLDLPVKLLPPPSFVRNDSLLCSGGALCSVMPPLPLNFSLPYAAQQILSYWKNVLLFYSKQLALFFFLINLYLFVGNQNLEKQVQNLAPPPFSFQELKKLKQQSLALKKPRKLALLSNQNAGEFLQLLLPILYESPSFNIQKLQLELPRFPLLTSQKTLNISIEAEASAQEARKVILQLQKNVPAYFQFKNKINWKNENQKNYLNFSICKTKKPL